MLKFTTFDQPRENFWLAQGGEAMFHFAKEQLLPDYCDYFSTAAELEASYNHCRSLKVSAELVKPQKVIPKTAFIPRLKDNSLPEIEQKLSRRQQEILQFLASGLTYKEIADKCSLSLQTVKTHCRNIYRRVGVNNPREFRRKIRNHFWSQGMIQQNPLLTNKSGSLIQITSLRGIKILPKGW